MIGYIQTIKDEQEREKAGKSYHYEVCSLLTAFFGNEKIRETKEGVDFVLNLVWDKEITISIEKEGKIEEDAVGICSYQEISERRNYLKRFVYKFLCSYTNKTLPWGTLTGIRPTKIALDLLNEGKTKEEIIDFYQEEYLTTEQKANMCSQIAKQEQKLLNEFPYEDQYSLYIGIPFCPSTCLYCSFTSYPIHQYEKKTWEYLKALKKEIAYIKEAMEEKGKVLSTIYMGGGTPTSLSAEQLDDLLSYVRTVFDLDNPKSQLLEFTVEAGRPDSITREKLRALKKNKIDRISINPQTMKNDTLKLIGRAHSVEDTKKAFEMAREEGISNINMDMIVGLPGEELSDVENTLKEIEKMRPESLTVHSLAIKRAANLNIQMEKYRSLVKGSTNEMLMLVDEYAKKLDLVPYYLYRQKNIPGNLENVGYAKEGLECLYNILIMEEKQTIMAAGAGATTKYVCHSENRIERAENVKNVDQYMERIDEMIERKRALLLKG